jgi:hypothetical protein
LLISSIALEIAQNIAIDYHAATEEPITICERMKGKQMKALLHLLMVSIKE